MPRAKRYNQDGLIERLKEEGLERAGKGKHGVKMTKPGLARPVIVPRDHGGLLPIGLTRAILKQAGVEDDKEE